MTLASGRFFGGSAFELLGHDFRDVKEENLVLGAFLFAEPARL